MRSKTLNMFRHPDFYKWQFGCLIIVLALFNFAFYSASPENAQAIQESLPYDKMFFLMTLVIVASALLLLSKHFGIIAAKITSKTKLVKTGSNGAL